MGEIEDLVSLLKAKEDTKFAILNIVINASVSVSNRVNLAIKQHEDCISRCIDKKSTINGILDSFDFSTTKAGQLFIHQGFYIGDDYNDRMDVLTNYYFNIGLNESEIEEDAKSFFILFHQRSSLLKILNKDETVRTELKKESDNKDDKELLPYFYGNEGIMNKFLTRINGKAGKKVAIEIKALSVDGKIDFSNAARFLRIIGIGKNQQDGVTRYFRVSNDNQLTDNYTEVVEARAAYIEI